MKKKILIIIGSLELGGTEKQLFNTIKYLKDTFNFEICLISNKGLLAESFEKLGIKVRTNFHKRKNTLFNFFSYYFLLPFHILRTVRNFEPSIIHYYLPQAYILAGFLPYIFPKKKFIMSRRSLNFYQRKYPKILKTFEKILHKRMDLIIGNSLAVCNQLQHDEKVEKERCILIYNGIEPNKILKEKKNRKVSLLCVANFIPYKNHLMLIMACRGLQKELGWKLTLVGKDSHGLVNNLMLIVKKNGLQKNIKFISQTKNLNPFLKSSDIGILTSDEEGFSNSILEYMNYSLPVVATNVGGNKEAIINGKNGFLVEKNNINQLTKKLELLISDEKLRKKMGIESKRLINRNYDIKKCITKYKKVYNLVPCFYDFNEKKINISVVIPHYNDSQRLKKAITSVINQTISVREILIIDDNSCRLDLENLKKLKVQFKSKIRIIHKRKNHGACYCRNIGFNQANAEFIALLDSDDYWMSDKLEKQLSYMLKNNLDFSCTSFELLNIFNKKTEKPKVIRYKEQIMKKDLVWGCFLSPGSTAIIKKSFLHKNNLFQNEKLRRLEDWDWLINIEKKTKILFLDEPLSFINVTKKPSFELINSSVKIFRKSVVENEKKFTYKMKFLSSLYLEKSSAALYSDKNFLFLVNGILAFLIFPFRNFNFFSRSLSLLKFFFIKKTQSK